MKRRQVALGSARPVLAGHDQPAVVAHHAPAADIGLLNGSLAHQAVWLATAPPVQRQAATLAIGHARGNRHVQRLVGAVRVGPSIQRAPVVGGGATPLPLERSVGEGGANQAPDVTLVQQRLLVLGALDVAALVAEAPPAGAAVSVPEAALERTIAAIKGYQRAVLHYRHPDGRVDPGERTARALAAMSTATAAPGPAAAATGPVPGPPAPGPAPAESSPAASPPGPATSEPVVAPPSTASADAGQTGAGATTAAPPGPATQDLDVLAARYPGLAPVVAEIRQVAGIKQVVGKATSEESGEQRRALVAGIGRARATVNALQAEALGMDAATFQAVKGQLHLTLTRLTPYYSQGNNANVLTNKGKEAAKLTCNVTSMSMTLEGLGKGPGDFTGHWPLLNHLATYFAGKLGQAGVAVDVAGLRLPDFMQLVATYLVLTEKDKDLAGGMGLDPAALAGMATGDPPAFAEQVDRARAHAAGKVIYRSGDFDRFTRLFGAGMRSTATTHGGALDLFGQVTAGVAAAAKKKGNVKSSAELRQEVSAYFAGREQAKEEKVAGEVRALEAKIAALTAAGSAVPRATTRQLEQKRREVAGIARRRQIYEAAASEATMEQAVPLALYKASVLGPLRKVLAEGKQVIVSQHNHFVRLEAIDDREIVIDDPGWRTRKNQRLTWAEARAIGLFLRYMVVG